MKLWDEIEKDKQQVKRNVTSNDIPPRLTDILDSLPDDVTLDKIDHAPFTGYFIAGIRIGDTHYVRLRYDIANRTITVGNGGFLTTDKTKLGAAFWQDPEVVHAIRIWMDRI